MTKPHPAAIEGFEAGAATYAAGRPGYPPEIDDWLETTLGLGPGQRRSISARGRANSPSASRRRARVTAIEPVAAMRAEFVRDFPGVPVLEAAWLSLDLTALSVRSMLTC